MVIVRKLKYTRTLIPRREENEEEDEEVITNVETKELKNIKEIFYGEMMLVKFYMCARKLFEGSYGISKAKTSLMAALKKTRVAYSQTGVFQDLIQQLADIFRKLTGEDGNGLNSLNDHDQAEWKRILQPVFYDVLMAPGAIKRNESYKKIRDVLNLHEANLVVWKQEKEDEKAARRENGGIRRVEFKHYHVAHYHDEEGIEVIENEKDVDEQWKINGTRLDFDELTYYPGLSDFEDGCRKVDELIEHQQAIEEKEAGLNAPEQTGEAIAIPNEELAIPEEHQAFAMPVNVAVAAPQEPLANVKEEVVEPMDQALPFNDQSLRIVNQRGNPINNAAVNAAPDLPTRDIGRVNNEMGAGGQAPANEQNVVPAGGQHVLRPLKREVDEQDDSDDVVVVPVRKRRVEPVKPLILEVKQEPVEQ